MTFYENHSLAFYKDFKGQPGFFKPYSGGAGSPLSPCFSLFSHNNNNLLPRVFEATVGAQLLRLPGDLYYWREKNKEVDFIFQYEKTTYAIEVKWGNKKPLSGMEAFLKTFKTAVPVFINRHNYENFLTHTSRFLQKNQLYSGK